MNSKNVQPGFWWQLVLHQVNQSVSEKLFKLGSTGLMEEYPNLTAYFPSGQFENPDKAVEAIHAALGAAVHVTVSQIPTRDWGSEWKKYFKPTKVGNRFVIRPSWETYKRKKNERVLIIDPKMSFGTGTHESTRLVLQMMEKYVRSRAVVLDAGTGTGILAIAAVKLKAAKVFGFDIDEHSSENARENIRRNRCTGKISVIQSTLDQLPKKWPKRFDLILANIQRSVITAMLDDLTAKLKSGGLIIVSGILTTEIESMLSVFHDAGLSVVDQRIDGEWVVFVLTK
ncbi:50S ribosomal protein L11 methyltransferase [bacterium]|nr:50S ribosomal protein L11 methyltransferase [bacterium]